jgi:endonuclease/exonuclease/phosphatase family metal-dependent hydrolase
MRLLLPLLLAFVAAASVAQDLPPVGTPATLDVATWNVEHFGNDDEAPLNDELQFENVLAVLQAADIDLWALQEMDIGAEFDALVDALGAPYDGVWVADETSFPVGYGFIYNADVVQRLSAQTILDDAAYDFAFRPPLLLRADVTLPDTTVADVRFINVHAKCCGDAQSYSRRVDASAALKGYVDAAILAEQNVLVMGDFNDELRTSIAGGASPYQNFRDDEEDYTFVSYVLDLANIPTFCSNQSCEAGSTLDHLLATRALADDYEASSIERYDAVLEEIPQYVGTTSDHLPVYARFAFEPVTTDAEDGVVPTAFALHAPFPNPFRDVTTLTYALPEPTDVRLEVFDALGRQVATVAEGAHAAGTHEVRFTERGLAPGLYLVRLTAGAETATRRLVHVP